MKTASLTQHLTSLFCVLALTVFCQASHALNVFKHVSDDGVITFTDKYPSGEDDVAKIELEPAPMIGTVIADVKIRPIPRTGYLASTRSRKATRLSRTPSSSRSHYGGASSHNSSRSVQTYTASTGSIRLR